MARYQYFNFQNGVKRDRQGFSRQCSRHATPTTYHVIIGLNFWCNISGTDDYRTQIRLGGLHSNDPAKTASSLAQIYQRHQATVRSSTTFCRNHLKLNIARTVFTF